eukprot:6663703-Karenia_brevis.AAC.1
MISIHATPCTLADDVLVTAQGPRALHIFDLAFNLTITHLSDIGGKLSPHKSKFFATCTLHRKWLTGFSWDVINQCISVVSHLRDLGSTLSVSFLPTTILSQTRIERGIQTLHKIRQLPHAKKQKCVFVRTAAHSRSFYGCEASHVDEAKLRKYTSLLTK